MTDIASRPPPSSPAWLRTGRRILAPLLVVVVLAFAFHRENESRPLDFWSMNEDYSNVCLAHGLNMDFWLSASLPSEGRQLTDLNTFHPGFPLQATSWAAYRLASFGKGSDARSRCASTFADPSAFWLTIRLIAIAIGMVCSALCARAASSRGFFYSMAVGLFYFCYDPAWDYSIRLLGNETFALPLALAVAWVAGRSLTSGENGSALKWWGAWGALCAVCWFNKLNYIAWTAAAVPAWAVYFALRRPSVLEMGRRILVFGLGFIGAAYGFASLFLGKGGLGRIVRSHLGVLTHSGSYGGGSEQVVSVNAIQTALHSLMEFRHFLALAGVLCLMAVWIVFSLVRRGKAAASDATLIVYLLCAAGLFLAATLKHYGSHYLVAGVPAVTLLMLAIGGHIGPKLRLLLSVAVALVLTHSYRRYSVNSGIRYRDTQEIKTSLQTLDDLSSKPGSTVLWAYRLPDRRFGMEHTQLLAEIPEIGAVIDENFPTHGLGYFPWSPTVRVGSEQVPLEQAKWRYAVFETELYRHFIIEQQTGTRELFEKKCKRIVNGPNLSVFERLAD